MNDLADRIECPCCGGTSDRVRLLCELGDAVRYCQYECLDCGFQFTWPVPSAEEISRFYSKSYYQGTSEVGRYGDYDDQIRDTLSFFREWLKRIGNPPGCRLLDVGCAIGRYMALAQGEFGYDCTGIEISDYARQTVCAQYGERFPLYPTIESLPFQGEPFDVILLFDVIEHVNSPWELLWPLFQKGCIGENTRVLITTPNVGSVRAQADAAGWQYRYPPAHLSFLPAKALAFVANRALFRQCAVTGHSPLLEEFRASVSVRDSYAFFDGLYCEFSGSILGGLPSRELSLSWQEAVETEAYGKLAASFLSTMAPMPHNDSLDALVSNRFGQDAEAQKDLRDSIAAKDVCIAELEAEWHRLIAANKQCSTALVAIQADLNAKSAEIANLRERVAVQGHSLRSVNDLLVKSKHDLAARERTVAGLQQECARLSDERRAAWADADLAKRKLSVVEYALNSREERLAAVEAWGREFGHKYDELVCESRRLAEERDALRTAYASKTAHCRRLAARCDALQSACAALSSAKWRRILRFARLPFRQKVRRIARWCLTPFRNAVARYRRLCEQISDKVRAYGGRYVVGMVISRLIGHSPVKRFSVVTSIGVNCEVSFNFNRIFGFVDSYPLVWAFVDRVGDLPKILSGGDDVARNFEPNEMVHDHSCNMCLCPALGVHFHCQGGAEELLDERGNFSEERALAARAELSERMRYLLEKQRRLLEDRSRSVLCVLTPWEWTTTDEILKVNQCLRRYPKVSLLVVVTGKERQLSKAALRRHGVFVRMIAFHPQHNAVTDESKNDICGWNRIFHEFQPVEMKQKTKKFKYER